MEAGRNLRTGMAAAVALLALAALPGSGTAQEGEKCAKCMDYNHCNWYDPPVGRYENCTNFPCEYSGEECSAIETLAFNEHITRREMRLPTGGFVRLVGIGDGLFASYTCDKALVAAAVEDSSGRLRLLDPETLRARLSWASLTSAVAELER